MIGVLLALAVSLTDWPATAEAIAKSVVEVSSTGGNCTGFVINAQWKGDKDLILTADHCYGTELYADGSLGRAIFRDGKRDLMIIEVDNLDRPAVTLSATNPRQGQEIVSYGYGMALDAPLFRHAWVSSASVNLPDVEGGPFVMIDAAYVKGQSGGPCINEKGEIVSIVQRASGLVGIGVGVERIRDRIGRYLQKPAKP